MLTATKISSAVAHFTQLQLRGLCDRPANAGLHISVLKHCMREDAAWCSYAVVNRLFELSCIVLVVVPFKHAAWRTFETRCCYQIVDQVHWNAF